jgi:hypothetical protein
MQQLNDPEFDRDSGSRQVPEPALPRKGIAEFFGLNIGIWSLVIVLSIVFLAVILWFAL